MHHHTAFHDPVLVALSILIAALASYTALDLATRMRAASGRARRAWLAAAAIAMGGGIWSMHFVGMLAFSLPGIEISYDPFLTLLSLVIPIVVAAAAFAVVGRRPQALLASGFAMGLGISGMHYTGMAAMRMAASIEYDPRWVVLSIVIAISASVVALWLAFRNTSAVQRLFAGLVMGLAISGMHYAAMEGALFVPAISIAGQAGHLGVGQAPLAFLLAGTTIMILSIGIAAAVYDRASAERAQREADALRRSEERFRLLVEGIADHAIFMLEPDGRVGNWNLGARRLMGYGDDIVGTSYTIFHTEEDRAAGVPARALLEAEREGKSAIEGWRVRKDGSRFWAEVTIVAVRNESGAITGFAKIVRDVSERRRAQEALERAREALMMSQKMETIGQLTGGVAHDFNNLLAAVLGSLELLKKRLPSDDPKIQRLVDNAMQGALRGASLTQRMLAFARKQDLRPAVVDVRELVRGMASLLKFEAGIRIETLFPMDLPKVKVDANQLELAILNLAVNARDAMPDGGLITIAAREEQDDGGLPAQPLRCALGERHRLRHGRGDAQARPGAVLYDQGRRQGHRARTVNGPRSCRAVRRQARIEEPPRRGHDSRDLAADRRGGRGASPARGGSGVRYLGPAGGFPCLSSTTTSWCSRTRPRCWRILGTPWSRRARARRRWLCSAARAPSTSLLPTMPCPA